jgi:hypothetical protein
MEEGTRWWADLERCEHAERCIDVARSAAAINAASATTIKEVVASAGTLRTIATVKSKLRRETGLDRGQLAAGDRSREIETRLIIDNRLWTDYAGLTGDDALTDVKPLNPAVWRFGVEGFARVRELRL